MTRRRVSPRVWSWKLKRNSVSMVHGIDNHGSRVNDVDGCITRQKRCGVYFFVGGQSSRYIMGYSWILSGTFRRDGAQEVLT